MIESTEGMQSRLGESEYAQKPPNYFAGVRRSFVDALPSNPGARLLELGCGNGDTAAHAKAVGKCGWTTGIELCTEPATVAAKQLDQVLVGNIEEMDLPLQSASFDILMMSEVLEHLREPKAVLCKLYALLAPGAIILAGSPNVAHRSVIRMLLKGQWELEDKGIMDRTHLRWFTPTSYRKLFEECGYQVEFSGPASPLRFKASCVDRLTLGRFQHLFHSQIYLMATKR